MVSVNDLACLFSLHIFHSGAKIKLGPKVDLGYLSLPILDPDQVLTDAGINAFNLGQVWLFR
jgi:hypothetical protein